MKQIIYILTLFIFSCKAQQPVYPLNTSASKLPSNAYFKDLNNELNYYTGTWKATFQDNAITLQISKQIKAPIELFGKNFYRDQLFTRYEVRKNGVILESTLNKDFTNDTGFSVRSAYTLDSGNSVTLLFSGGNCNVGIGTVVLKKINSTQLSWGYYPGTTTRNDITCPTDKDYTIYLPETKDLIFTKQ